MQLAAISSKPGEGKISLGDENPSAHLAMGHHSLVAGDVGWEQTPDRHKCTHFIPAHNQIPTTKKVATVHPTQTSSTGYLGRYQSYLTLADSFPSFVRLSPSPTQPG